MRFRTILEATGKTTTGIVVPPELVEELGAGKRPPVRVTINGYTYRNTVAAMGGAFWVGVSAEHRAGAGVAAGDHIEVELELDTAPREVTVPPDLADALDRDPAAKQFFAAPFVQQPAPACAGDRGRQDGRDAPTPRCQGGRDVPRGSCLTPATRAAGSHSSTRGSISEAETGHGRPGGSCGHPFVARPV